MLKGTSRQMVEICGTDDPYFERAFLVVRPECADLPPERLDSEAGRFLRRQTPYTGIRRARVRGWWERAACLALGGGLGAIAALVGNALL